MSEFADPKLIAHWEARLIECQGGADIARAALAKLGVIYPLREVEAVETNVHQLHFEPEWPDGGVAV